MAHSPPMPASDLSALIRKYNRPGPRYTSYPTAVQFQPIIDTVPYLDDSSTTNPLSLYIHLPFCESLCWFCACTTVITCSRGRADTYLDYLEREIDAVLPHLNAANRTVNQLHLGGGSPSFLTPAQIERLGRILHSRFRFSQDAECSAELDPRTLSAEKVAALAAQGFNRASLGIQDVHPEVQQAIHRIQPDSLNRECIEWIRQAGIPGLNIDLIYGLPKQSVQRFHQTLLAVLDYQPDRFAVFSYAHVPWVAPAQKILEKKDLPDPETKFAMLLDTIDTLTGHGYHFIGMDHFSRKGDALEEALREGGLHRNFQGYTTRAGADICAFGMSAISQTPGTYRQNHKDLDQYYAALDESRIPLLRGCCLNAEDQLRRDIIMTIMCSGNVSFSAFNKRYGIDFAQRFAGALRQLEEPARDGLLEWLADGFQVTARGRFLLRNIAMPFDAYLTADARHHAKTV